MIGFEQIHMTNPFVLAAVRSGNDVVYWAQLLLNGIWAMVLGMRGFPGMGISTRTLSPGWKVHKRARRSYQTLALDLS